VQTKAQQDRPLKKICAGDPYRIGGLASFAENLNGHEVPFFERRGDVPLGGENVRRHNMTTSAIQSSTNIQVY
jgi:hypothetical protein